MAEWYYQREANVLGADYFERQGWHPPKEKMSKDEKKDEMQEVASVLAYQRTIGVDNRITELEKENKLLGERCNQLLKDKGELTDKIADIKANCDFAIEGRDIKIKELEQQIEKLLDFVVERTVCCDVCPSSDTCRNDEGTCPHAGLLKENEEKVTREWILKSITKE